MAGTSDATFKERLSLYTILPIIFIFLHCWSPLCIALNRTHQADRDRYLHVMNYEIWRDFMSEYCPENGVTALSTAHICLTKFDIQQASSARPVSKPVFFCFFFPLSLSFPSLFDKMLLVFISGTPK